MLLTAAVAGSTSLYVAGPCFQPWEQMFPLVLLHLSPTGRAVGKERMSYEMLQSLGAAGKSRVSEEQGDGGGSKTNICKESWNGRAESKQA